MAVTRANDRHEVRFGRGAERDHHPADSVLLESIIQPSQAPYHGQRLHVLELVQEADGPQPVLGVIRQSES